MKTKIIISSILISFLTIALSCKKKEVEIIMQIIPQEVSANSENKLRIENLSKKDIFYNTNYSLEYFDKTKWEKIQLNNTAWETTGIICKANDTTITSINLYSLIVSYNCSKQGKYRLQKTLDGQNLYAEFELK